MSQIIKSYKKFLIRNFFYIPVWILRIIFPQIRTKIRGSKIDFQSYAFIKLNPKSTLHRIKEKDLPWMNPQNNRKKWLKLTRRLRLVVGRIEFETNEQKERTIH